VKELIALARARPNEISYSSPGVGNTGHLAAALFDSMAKIKTVHVPYKGTAPAVIAMLSGETQLTWSSIPAILPHVRAGRAKALGVGNTKRLPSLPDFPTVAEAGVPGFECVAWGGMIGPANLPRDIVNRLNKEIVDTLKQKDVIDRMLSEGTVPSPSSPDEFLAYMKSELKKWGEVVKIAGIKPE
jgi:tripartite-type tricarboxylate transporter receptor subunit TctC